MVCGDAGIPVDVGEGEGETEGVAVDEPMVEGSESGGTGKGFCSPWLGPSE